MGGGEVIHSGYLVKSPPLNKNGSCGVKRWKNRWCVLRRSKVLEYYEDKNAKAPKGVINLEECNSVESGLQLRMKKGKHVFDLVTAARTFYFCAPSLEEEKKWVEVLCEQCGFHLDVDAGQTAKSLTLDPRMGKTPSGKSPSRRSSMPMMQRQPSVTSDGPADVDCLSSPDEKHDVPEVQCAFTPNGQDEPQHGRGSYEDDEDEGIDSQQGSPPESPDESGVIQDPLQQEPKVDGKTTSVLETYDIVSGPDHEERIESEPISIPSSGQSHRSGRHLVASSEDEMFSASSPPSRPPKSLTTQPLESAGYATLTADDFKPPVVDRTRKPRNSVETPVDPDAPPIDRSQKPSGPLNVSATIPIEGSAFMQIPEVTATTRRYSRPTFYAVPPGSVTMVPVPAHSLPAGAFYSVPPTLERSISTPTYRQHIPSNANYDVPPQRLQRTPSMTSTSSSNYDIPPSRSAHYDYPRGAHPGAPRLQRSMSASPASYGGSRTPGPEDAYSYPPPPVPANVPQQMVIGNGVMMGPRHSRSSVDSRISVGSRVSRTSHSTLPPENDGGDYLFTEPAIDDSEESYEYMAAGVMSGSSAPPARPPKPSV